MHSVAAQVHALLIGIDLFTDTAAILNYLDLRSVMGCPGGMSTSQYTHSVFTRAFRAIFSFRFPRKRLQWEKKIVFGRNNECLFPGKYTVKFSFCPKSARKYLASAPGHPIILLKSSEFNMATVSVKMSIGSSLVPSRPRRFRM